MLHPLFTYLFTQGPWTVRVPLSPFPIYARNDSSLCGTLPGPQPSCQSDSACDYDLWSTGNASLAQRTLQFSQRYQELQSELRPGIIIYVNTGVFIMIGAWVKDNAFFNLMYCRGNSNWRPTFFFECTVFIFSFSQIQQSDTHHIDKNDRYYMYARIWSLVYSCIIPIRLAVSSNFLDNILNRKMHFSLTQAPIVLMWKCILPLIAD